MADKVTANREYGMDAVSPYPPELTQKETSISAHIVRMISVTMSYAEMDILCGIIDQAMRTENLTQGHMTVGREFIHAIESLR